MRKYEIMIIFFSQQERVMYKGKWGCSAHCDGERMAGLTVVEYDVAMKERAEKANAQILSLYKQMKL
jgi:hypothetical protein